MILNGHANATQEQRERAHEDAIEMLVSAGVEGADTLDELGEPIEDTAQAFLAEVLLRVPELANIIPGRIDQ